MVQSKMQEELQGININLSMQPKKLTGLIMLAIPLAFMAGIVYTLLQQKVDGTNFAFVKLLMIPMTGLILGWLVAAIARSACIKPGNLLVAITIAVSLITIYAHWASFVAMVLENVGGFQIVDNPDSITAPRSFEETIYFLLIHPKVLWNSIDFIAANHQWSHSWAPQGYEKVIWALEALVLTAVIIGATFFDATRSNVIDVKSQSLSRVMPFIDNPETWRRQWKRATWTTC